MEIDDEGGDTEIEGDGDGDDTDDDSDEEMAEDSSIPSETGSAPVTPQRKSKSKKNNKKKKSLKPRKSSLNLESLKTLTNEQAALAALESNQILHLRLRKKYYAEGLNFIRMVEGAMCVFVF
jgi:condensin complex subunit 1